MKRRFIDAPTEQRCSWTVRLADGSEAQCGRYTKVRDLCTQHHKMHEAKGSSSRGSAEAMNDIGARPSSLAL